MQGKDPAKRKYEKPDLGKAGQRIGIVGFLIIVFMILLLVGITKCSNESQPKTPAASVGVFTY